MTIGSGHHTFCGAKGSKLAWLGHVPFESLLVPGLASPWVLTREKSMVPPDFPLPIRRLGFELLEPDAPFAELAIIAIDDRGIIHLFNETEGAETVVEETRDGARIRRYLTRDFYVDNEYGPVFPMAALAPSGHLILSGPRSGVRLLGPDGVAIPNRLSKRFGPTEACAFWGDNVAAGPRLGWLSMGSEYYSLDYRGRRHRTVRGPDVGGQGAFFAFEGNRLVVAYPGPATLNDPTSSHRLSIVVLDLKGDRLLKVTLDVSDHGLARATPAPIGLDRRGWLWWSCLDDGKLAIGATDLSAGLFPAEAGCAQSGQGDVGSGVCT